MRERGEGKNWGKLGVGERGRTNETRREKHKDTSQIFKIFRTPQQK
jgi:hypothetical protein